MHIIHPGSPQQGNQPIKAFAWMCLTLLSFIGLAVSVRELSQDYSAYQILAVRSVIGVLIVSSFIGMKNPLWFISQSPKTQIIRNLFHFIGQYLWVVGIGLLPLAEVFALEFTTPVWAALLAWLFLGERITFARQVALVCGVTGLLMIVKPTSAVFNSASILVVISALFFASSLIFVKKLSKFDNTATILFYFCLIQMPCGLIPAVFNWAEITPQSMIWFFFVGITGLTAHLGITKAIQNADLMFIQPIDFLRVPLVALTGYYLYSEQIDFWLLCGALIIFSGNFYNLKSEVKAGKD